MAAEMARSDMLSELWQEAKAAGEDARARAEKAEKRWASTQSALEEQLCKTNKCTVS